MYAQRLKKFIKEAFLPKEEGSPTEQVRNSSVEYRYIYFCLVPPNSARG
jgi:hypothetical protein